MLARPTASYVILFDYYYNKPTFPSAQIILYITSIVWFRHRNSERLVFFGMAQSGSRYLAYVGTNMAFDCFNPFDYPAGGGAFNT